MCSPFSFTMDFCNVQRGQIIDVSEATGISGFLSKTLLKTPALNFMSSPNFIMHDIDSLSEGYALNCRKKNLPILGYTARNEAQLTKAKKLCDGIIFEEITIAF